MTTPENTLRVGISDPHPSFRGAFANRDFSFLFIGQLGSEIGNGAVQLALPWLVLKLTDSAFQLGFAYFFQFSPMLLFGILGGVFVDRWDRRLTIVIDETKAGLKVIMRARLLQVSVLLGFVLNLVVAPIQVLIPLFVRDIKHAAVGYFGVMVAGLLVGLLVGSLTAPQTARRIGLGPMAIGAVSLLGIVISIAAWPPGLWPPVVAMFIAGTAVGSLNVAQITLIQGSTSDDERGRVSATYYTATLGVRPVGFLAMGALASAVDIRFLFVALGVMALLVGIVLSQIREVREHR